MILRTFIVLLFCIGILPAQDGIVFLHLRLKNNTITLIESKIHPGTLKEDRTTESNDGILIEVVSNIGSIIFTNSVNDPSIRHYEFEDPNFPGRVISKEIMQNDVEFFVRIPYKKNAHQVRFYRTFTLHSSSKTKQLNRVIIGTASLQLQGVE